MTRIGRYELLAVLGEGAFGRVYRAKDPELDREVAIKVPHAKALTPELRERFLREARASATIHHPNVCPIYDVGKDGDVPYLVMAFVAGGTLAGLSASRKQPFPAAHAAAIVRKIALGVAAAHGKHVLHRDLKPANVLWNEAARDVLVTDFGLARIGGASQITQDGQIQGTPAYMSPEQARGRQDEIGPLTDVYSLGVILYEMTTGRLPFAGTVLEVLSQAQFEEPQSPSTIRFGLDPRISDICLKALAKKPEDRYASAKDFAAALADYIRISEKPDSGTGSAVSLPPDPAPAPQAPRPIEPLELILESISPAPAPTPVVSSIFVPGPRPRPMAARARPVEPEPTEPAIGKVPSRWAVVATGFAILSIVGAFFLVRMIVLADKPSTTQASGTGSGEKRTPGTTREIEIAPGMTMTFCWIPPGTAQLGSPRSERDAVLALLNEANEPDWLRDESEEKRGTYATKGFWIGKHEVTQAEWAAVMKGAVDEGGKDLARPSHFRVGGGGEKGLGAISDTSRFPVEDISANHCTAFLNRANANGGIAKAFGKAGEFALPHEDEWEYACRGGLGNRRPFYFGTVLNGTQANCDGNFPVGTATKGDHLERSCLVDYTNQGAYGVHPWGLKHMHGNVWEWCSNTYEQTTMRVVRGGSWSYQTRYCRSATRNWYASGYRSVNIGFRVLVPRLD